jgi:hypothetical protein
MEMGLMKTRIYQLTIVLMACMLFLACHSAAVRPTPANYGNNIVTSTVDAFCIGTFTVDHEMQWSQTSDDRGFGHNPIAFGESQVDYTYREATVGYHGIATYLKDFGMNGGNAQAGLDNLNINHAIDFQRLDGTSGTLLFDEMARMDAYGAPRADSTDNPVCIFAAPSGGPGNGSYKGHVTVGSQMNVQEVSARMSIGSAGISNNPNAPVNLRYTFDAEGLATSDVGHAVGAARVYSDVDMHVNNSYHANVDKDYQDCLAELIHEAECEALHPGSRAPGMNGYFQDSQRQSMRGLFDLATTFEYTN